MRIEQWTDIDRQWTDVEQQWQPTYHYYVEIDVPAVQYEAQINGAGFHIELQIDNSQPAQDIWDSGDGAVYSASTQDSTEGWYYQDGSEWIQVPSTGVPWKAIGEAYKVRWFKASTTDLTVASYNLRWRTYNGVVYGDPHDESASWSYLVLSKPTSLVSLNKSFTGFTASWDAVDNAELYQIHLFDSDDYSTHIGEYFTSDTDMVISGLAPGAFYYWRVRALADMYEASPWAHYEAATRFLVERTIFFDSENLDERGRIEMLADGRLCRQTPSMSTDLGQSIDSYVIYPPRRLAGSEFSIGTLRKLWIVMGENSGDITWELLAGDTFQEVLDKDASLIGTTAGGGRQQIVRRRLRAPVMALKVIGGSEPWAIESILTESKESGRQK
jgi:hypothetical protein